MAAVFSFSETYGATATSTTRDTNYLNFLNTDDSSGTNETTATAASPITIPSGASVYSYERWVRGHWSGSFSTITAVTFHKQSGSLGTGVLIYGADRTSQTYAAPTGGSTSQSAIATTVCTSWDTVGEAFGLGYSTNYSDYVVMQLEVANTAASGSIGSMVYRIGWNET